MEKYDAIVIGSGAGGSVMAYRLAAKGLRVAVIEKGKRHDHTVFRHSELKMFPALYKNGGLQTSKDNSITIAQGANIGGSTVINNAIWLRPDLDRILPDWNSKGAYVPRDKLEENYEILEKALHVQQIRPECANAGAKVFMRGCKSMGIPAKYLDNNRDQCLGCGWCNYGCKYNRKTSMLVTFIPWAEKRGVIFMDECLNATVQVANRRATGVRFNRYGKEEVLLADRVVVSSGAIGSSAVLLQSGVHLDGRVGDGFHFLGGAFVTAETEEDLNGYDGIGLTCVAEASDDYVIESYFAPPLVFSISVGGFFLTHFNRMTNYARYADAGVMVGTDPKGKITLDRQNNPVIDISFDQKDMDRLKEGIKTLSRIFFRGGATRVMPSTFNIIEFSKESDLDLVDQLIRRPEDLTLGTAHPQGGNPMCEDPKKGVVGLDFRVHGYENLYVADTSVFPTNIWANCQATAMAMSFYAAEFVAR
jgi:choline dehydrogenase-like flavoprotein